MNIYNSAGIALCYYCQTYHTGFCPRIKSMEFNSDGTVKRVELYPQPVTHEWSYVPPPTALPPSRGHSCNCVGCCRLCGCCRTNPVHTKEYCDLLVKQKEERVRFIQNG